MRYISTRGSAPALGFDFAPLMAWLREKVHGQGAFYTTDALIAHATGKPLDPKVFEAHLKARYLG